MYNRRLIGEMKTPFPWIKHVKLYKVKALRKWIVGARRVTFIDISVHPADHPRFRQHRKAVNG